MGPSSSLQPSSIPSLSPSLKPSSSPSVTPSFKGFCLDKNAKANYSYIRIGSKITAEECLALCKSYGTETPSSGCQYSKSHKSCGVHKYNDLLPPIHGTGNENGICWPLS